MLKLHEWQIEEIVRLWILGNWKAYEVYRFILKPCLDKNKLPPLITAIATIIQLKNVNVQLESEEIF